MNLVLQCPECGYQYDEAKGDKNEGVAPGTPWKSLPEDYACPSCSVRTRDDFEPVADTETPPAN